MFKAKIKAISQYLPETVLTNEDINLQFPEWTPERIQSKIGIKSRHIASSESVSDMAVKASEKLFEEYDIDRNTIDFILLCTQSPDFFLPTTACIVQDRLNIPTSAGALDFNLGCSGYVYGLAVAKGLISTGIAKNILLITSEAYSKFIHEKDRGNKTIFGDAATATLISNEGFAEIMNFELGTDGSGANNLIVKNGAIKYPNRDGLDVDDGFGNIINPNNLYMDGPAILKFTLDSVPKLVNQTLQNNQLELSDINLAIFHQANTFILERLRKKIGFLEENFYIHIKDYGNTVSSTIPIALKHALETRKPEGNILLAGFGVGYSWGSCILQINK
jgi:3-oxoacyl-[acyl-carrier-protein] synthase-3